MVWYEVEVDPRLLSYSRKLLFLVRLDQLESPLERSLEDTGAEVGIEE